MTICIGALAAAVTSECKFKEIEFSDLTRLIHKLRSLGYQVTPPTPTPRVAG